MRTTSGSARWFFFAGVMLERHKSPPRPEKRYHEFPQTTHEDNAMNTRDTLTLKALLLKQSIHGTGMGSDMVDIFLEKNPEEMKSEMRNICAFIHKDLFAKVETTCTNLGLSKRQLVEMALIDIMEKADSIMARHNVFEGIDNQEEA